MIFVAGVAVARIFTFFFTLSTTLVFLSFKAGFFTVIFDFTVTAAIGRGGSWSFLFSGL